MATSINFSKEKMMFLLIILMIFAAFANSVVVGADLQHGYGGGYYGDGYGHGGYGGGYYGQGHGYNHHYGNHGHYGHSSHSW